MIDDVAAKAKYNYILGHNVKQLSVSGSSSVTNSDLKEILKVNTLCFALTI